MIDTIHETFDQETAACNALVAEFLPILDQALEDFPVQMACN